MSVGTNKMELLSPAGNIEKLWYAYEYGADAVYIGLKKYSLRIKADNFYENEYEQICNLKKTYPGKKLYCALNISFHNNDIDSFLSDIDYFKKYPIDAFIIQDLGIVPILQKNFPSAALHLSTQASCINREAVKMYKNLGFKRVVLGREASLKDIRVIKDSCPEMELEAFVHGAMCIAYSGRCLMSAYLTGRSANSGFCSHTCRWNYRLLSNPNISPQEIAQSGALVLQEQERPSEFFPVFEGDGFTEILSSKDLCMVDHLDDLRKAGVDSLKIEGRMKSLYYTALVTRAYRKALDALYGKISEEEVSPFVAELYKANHREFATGFFYNHEDADKTTKGASESEYEMSGTVGKELSEKEEAALFKKGYDSNTAFESKLATMHPSARQAELIAIGKNPSRRPTFATLKDGYHAFYFNPLNMIKKGIPLEFVGPDVLSISDDSFILIETETGIDLEWVCHDHPCVLYTDKKIGTNWIARIKCDKINKQKE